MMFNNILLAVDGSEHALHAARKAGDLARAMKSEELWIVVAYEPIPAYLGEPNMQHAITRRLLEAESILERAVEAVGHIPGEIRKEMLEGSPAEEVIKVADSRKADLIIMGSRGLGQLAGLMLGSQVQKVVSHATCPVLIVR
jgi:nucleotide-binding universal stress UspA family protein